jgi:hypothetical protein
MTGDYPNRSDLRGGSARGNYTGQTYGAATAQQQSQQMVPPGPPPTDQPAGLLLEQPIPGAADFSRMTERPDEPITAGVDVGPGPSSLDAGIRPRMVEFDDTIMMLQALYQKYPNPGLRKFLIKYGRKGF